MIGQLPDKSLSKDYDRAKAEYFNYCEANFKLGKATVKPVAPQKLFEREANVFLNMKRSAIILSDHLIHSSPGVAPVVMAF